MVFFVVNVSLFTISTLDLEGGMGWQISDHQQSWGYEDGPWKEPGPPLLVAADYKIEDVEGIGPVYGEKLRQAGINSVDQILKIGCNPENLLAKMTEVNSAGRQLVRALPSLSMVQSWVTLAKELDPMVTH